VSYVYESPFGRGKAMFNSGRDVVDPGKLADVRRLHVLQRPSVPCQVEQRKQPVGSVWISHCGSEHGGEGPLREEPVLLVLYEQEWRLLCSGERGELRSPIRASSWWGIRAAIRCAVPIRTW